MSESATSHIQPLSLSQRVANFHLYGCDATEPPYGRACSCGVWARLRLEIVTALSESATPNDWHEAQAEIHNLQRDREALRNENARRAAMFDAAIGQLVKIKGFVHPDGFVVNGKGYLFNPPIELVREAWEALSKAIREIEPPESASRCVVDTQSAQAIAVAHIVLHDGFATEASAKTLATEVLRIHER